MSEVVLIHEPDVFFDVVGRDGGNGGNGSNNKCHDNRNQLKIPADSLHHGEIYIYLNHIFLHNKRKWYKANIEDIVNIITDVSKKQILIRFINFEMILHCNDYTHLIALRDFLNLTQSMIPSNNFMIHTHDYERDLAILEGGNGH